MLFGPIVSALLLATVGTATGAGLVKKLIAIKEAKHELKHGSAGYIRAISGWSLIVFWLLTIWFCSTVIGDWALSGDLDEAMQRSWRRLRFVVEILFAIAK